MRTARNIDTNSKPLNTMLIGLNNKLKKISTGVTNKIICKLEPIAISTETSILFFSAMETAVECSAAFPIIGIKIIPTKRSLSPRVEVMASTPLTRNSLSMAIHTVEIASIAIAFFKDHLFLSSDSSSFVLFKEESFSFSVAS